jgi:hypothetical protein
MTSGRCSSEGTVEEADNPKALGSQGLPFSGRRGSFKAVLILASLWLSAAAQAAGYHELEPLLGSWAGKLNCGSGGDLIALKVRKTKDAVEAEYKSSQSTAKASAINDGVEGHYRIVAVVAGVQLLKVLHLDTIPGHLTVSDDTSDEDSSGRDYLTFGAELQQIIRFLGSAKLRDNFRTLSFQVKVDSPIFKDLCSGILKKERPPHAKRS